MAVTVFQLIIHFLQAKKMGDLKTLILLIVGECHFVTFSMCTNESLA